MVEALELKCECGQWYDIDLDNYVTCDACGSVVFDPETVECYPDDGKGCDDTDCIYNRKKVCQGANMMQYTYKAIRKRNKAKKKRG